VHILGDSPAELTPPEHEPDVGGHDGPQQGGVQAVLHRLPRQRLQVQYLLIYKTSPRSI
jgi:hypothetical protein